MTPVTLDQWVDHFVDRVRGQGNRKPSVGYAGYLRINFGADMGENDGEDYVWVTHGAWRIRSREELLVGVDDSDAEARVSILAGRSLQRIDVDPATMDAVFMFDGEIDLEIFAGNARYDTDHWMLWFADGQVLACSAGPTWSVEDKNTRHAFGYVAPERTPADLPDRAIGTNRRHVQAERLIDAYEHREVRSAEVAVNGGITLTTADLMLQVDAEWRIESKDGWPRVMLLADRDSQSAWLLAQARKKAGDNHDGGRVESTVDWIKSLVGTDIETIEADDVSFDLTIGFGQRTEAALLFHGIRQRRK